MQEKRRPQRYPDSQRNASIDDSRVVVVVGRARTLENAGLLILMEIGRRLDRGLPSRYDDELAELGRRLAGAPLSRRDSDRVLEGLAQTLPPAAA